ncbi:MFS transporter [Burkholderia gladioli]|uniref:Bcr/CflA subfamily drug resistance transporter n=1 Tax=Burkholderia gladioli (strain BSR3) TaxID=999541 RepID=F2LNL1_BURGS|nr:MFS transporter [Burkholderia gladioli]AEA64332.1 Bcr/CflA subfamily drug resistance transporter [Burkholderia gladioli BSR3]MBW5283970.1 MFS transporter [Burkholderia gladioli]
MPEISLADRPARLTACLALIAFLPMLSSDLFLPALPAIASALAVPVAATQRLFDSYFAGLALSLLVCGPLSDRHGRRRPLLAALALHAAASLAMAGAHDLATLSACRFAQGLASGIPVALWRSIAFDALPLEAATRSISVVVPVMVVSPALAPIVGEWIAALAGWRAIFAALAGVAALAFVLTRGFVPETHRPAPAGGAARQWMSAWLALARSRRFVSFCVLACAAYAAYFLYLFQAPLLLALGYTPRAISYAYLPVTAGFVLGSAVGRRLAPRAGDRAIVTAGTALFAAGAVLLAGWGVAGRPLGAAGLLLAAAAAGGRQRHPVDDRRGTHHGAVPDAARHQFGLARFLPGGGHGPDGRPHVAAQRSAAPGAQPVDHDRRLPAAGHGGAVGLSPRDH